MISQGRGGQQLRTSSFGTTQSATQSARPGTGGTTIRAQELSKPARFEITSPVVNGTYTRSIRDLTPFEIQNYQSRGFTLRQVDPSRFGLAPAVKISAARQVGRSGGTRTRRGNSRSKPAVIMHRKAIGTRRKSTIMPNPSRVVAENPGAYLPRGAFMETINDFAESTYNVRIIDNRGGTRNLTNVSDAVIRFYTGLGWRVQSKTPSYRSKSTRNTLSVDPLGRLTSKSIRDQGIGAYWLAPPGQKPRWVTTSKVGKDYYLAQGWTWPGRGFRGGTKPTAGSRTTRVPPPSSGLDGQKESLVAELKELRTWLHEVNTRTSQQLIELGKSTTDRSNEIQGLNQNINDFKAYYEEDKALIHETLAALGRATDKTDLAKAIKDAQDAIAKIQADLASTGNGKGILGGITDFFTTPSNLILIVIVVMMVVMIRK